MAEVKVTTKEEIKVNVFKVTISKELERVVEIEASNGFEAVDRVRDMYYAHEVSLDDNYLTSIDFKVNGPLIKE